MSKILTIDDDPDVRRVIVKLLSQKGFEVLEAADGKSGVGLASRMMPDLVICDLTMPEMDGYEVLSALRRDPRLADLPVIFLTGQSEPKKVRHGMNLGADDYLTKPVQADDLLDAIQARLTRRESVRRSLTAKAPAASPAGDSPAGSFLVTTPTEKRLVKTAEIKTIAAYGEYSRVSWDKGTQGALIRKSLKQWLAELPGDRFIRVHRGAIVNLAFLERVEKLPGGRIQIHLRDAPAPISVSQRLAPALNRQLKSLRP